MKKCSLDFCDRDELAKGFCTGHYKQWRRGIDLHQLRPKLFQHEIADQCTNSTKKCLRTLYSKGLCKSCYEVERRKNKKKNDNANESSEA